MPRGTRRLPKECLRLLAESDRILHAGDFGNMDEPELRVVLPPKLVLEHESVRIAMVHDAGPAAGRAARLVEAFPGCDAVVYGHTHVPEATRLGEIWILNPGSPTERRSAPHRGMIGLEVTNGELDVRTYVL
jgi:putative phosphoesterase